MKMSLFLGLLAPAFLLLFPSCTQIASTLNEPISSDYNPLDGPSAPIRRSSVQSAPTGPSYKPGQWVEAAMPNTTFFRKIPRGSASADQVLEQGTPLKVVSTRDSFIKVELESGSVGYVPSIMVAENAPTNDPSFLPPPPESPLQLQNSPSVPEATPGTLNPDGPTVIPPPSNFNSTTTPPSPEITTPTPPNSNEILIPTTPPADIPTIAPSPPTSGSIPAPSTNSGDTIDQTIGIE
ncbi:MAG: hypothetical protein AAGC74_03915 [Verrucomicrobiota bacterium]